MQCHTKYWQWQESVFYINLPNYIPATSKTVQIFIWVCLSTPKAQWDLSCFYAFRVRLFYNKAITPWGSHNCLHIHFLVSCPSFPIISQGGSCRPLTLCSPQQLGLISSMELRNQPERHTRYCAAFLYTAKPGWPEECISSDVKSVQLTTGEVQTNNFSLLMSLHSSAFHAKLQPKAHFVSSHMRNTHENQPIAFFHITTFVQVSFIANEICNIVYLVIGIPHPPLSPSTHQGFLHYIPRTSICFIPS